MKPARKFLYQRVYDDNAVYGDWYADAVVDGKCIVRGIGDNKLQALEAVCEELLGRLDKAKVKTRDKKVKGIVFLVVE